MLNEGGKPTYVCVYDDYGYGDNVQRANANFIVAAVNAHDALVAALRAVAQAKMPGESRRIAVEALSALAVQAGPAEPDFAISKDNVDQTWGR